MFKHTNCRKTILKTLLYSPASLLPSTGANTKMFTIKPPIHCRLFKTYYAQSKPPKLLMASPVVCAKMYGTVKYCYRTKYIVSLEILPVPVSKTHEKKKILIP